MQFKIPFIAFNLISNIIKKDVFGYSKNIFLWYNDNAEKNILSRRVDYDLVTLGIVCDITYINHFSNGSRI